MIEATSCGGVVIFRGKILVLYKSYRNRYEGWVLPKGTVEEGEEYDQTALREVREETGLTVTGVRFNHSHYFAPSNTLMLNFAVKVEGEVHTNEEVDTWAWFTLEEARQNIRKNSLAKAFLLGWLDGVYDFPEFPARPYR